MFFVPYVSHLLLDCTQHSLFTFNSSSILGLALETSALYCLPTFVNLQPELSLKPISESTAIELFPFHLQIVIGDSHPLQPPIFAMELLDFPPEIFQRITHQLVFVVGIREAWKVTWCVS